MHVRNLLATVTLILLPLHLSAAPGDLDPTFGSSGRAIVPMLNDASVVSAAVQLDGKIVAVGTTASPGSMSNFDVVAVRLNADGSLDNTFDGDGFALLDYGTEISSASAVCITSTGKILIAGDTVAAATSLYSTAIVRLNADGSRDTTFGVNGRRLYSFAEEMVVSKIREQADGKFVIGGNTPNSNYKGKYKFFRVDAQGATDTTFGDAGRSIVSFGGSGDELADFAIEAGGRIVGVGNSWTNQGPRIAVMRLLANGQLDTSAGGGKLALAIGDADFARSIYLQTDGKLLIAGETPSLGNYPLGMVVRLNSDGTPDTSFGSGGRVARAESILAVDADSAGRVYLAGELAGSALQLGMPAMSSAYVQALDVDGSAATDYPPRGRTALDFGHGAARSVARPVALFHLPDSRQLVIATNERAELLVGRLAGTGNASGGVISLSSPERSDYSAPYAVPEDQGTIRFTVSRSGGASGTVSVQYATTSSTATAGTDFTATSGTLSWLDGDVAPKTVTLEIIDDNDYELDTETVTMQLSTPLGGAVLGTSRIDVGVTSDESYGGLYVIGGVSRESAPEVEFVVRRSGDPRLAITAHYETPTVAYPAATPGVDFTPVSGTITWEPYDTGDRVIRVPIVNDSTMDEGAERIPIYVTTTSVGVSSAGPADAYIIDDDTTHLGQFALFDSDMVHVTEGATPMLVLRVWRINDLQTTSNDYTVVVLPYDFDVKTATEGIDFTIQTTHVSWPAGDTSPRNIVIPLSSDQQREGVEGFYVALQNQGLTYASARVFIEDDVKSAPGRTTISFAQTQFAGVEGQPSAAVTLVRSGDVSFPATAYLALASGTATYGADYYLQDPGNSMTVEWPAGDGSPKTFVLPLLDDNEVEAPETVEFSLVGTSIGARRGVITNARIAITDDESPSGPNAYVVGFEQDFITVSENAPYVDLPIVRTGQAGPASVSFAIVGGSTADNGTEFLVERFPQPVQFYASDSISTVRYARIYLNGDERIEGDETFTVQLTGTPGFMPLGRSTMTVTLTNDDVSMPRAVGFVSSAASAAENGGTVTLTVRRTGPTNQALSLHYETVAGTATAGADFVAATGNLQWGLGESSDKTIVITLSDDVAVESTETFTVKLRAPSNGVTVAWDTATVSITNDDIAPPSGGGSSSGGGGGGGGRVDWTFLGVLAALAALRRKGIVRGRSSRIRSHSAFET